MLNIGKTLDGKKFTLPLDLVTQTQAIVATKGKGKTYLAMVQTEEMLKAGAQVVCLDPTGVWYGLQADGEGKGFPIIVMGGEHGNVPLEPAAGEIIADFIVDTDQSVVLDLSHFESNAAQDRFVTAFAERLYRQKAKKRTPIHIMLDESDSFAPQRPMPGQQRMLGAFEAIVRRGRSRGIGMTLITQRPAVLNKNVLMMAELLTCLGIVGNIDQDAVDDWVKRYGTKEQREKFMATLASMPKGRAWFWSPAWLECFTQVDVRKKLTFDSSKTPEAGGAFEKPKHVAEPNLEKLSKQILATVEKAKAEDPRTLKKRIADLERELNLAKQVTAAKPCNHVEEIRALKAELELCGKALKKLHAFKDAVSKNATLLQKAVETLQQSANEDLTEYFVSESQKTTERLRILDDPPVNLTARQKRLLIESGGEIQRAVERLGGSLVAQSLPFHESTNPDLKPTQRKIINIIAALERFGISPATRETVAIHAGYASGGGAYNNLISSLRSGGFIDYVSGGLALTQAGQAVADPDGYMPHTSNLSRFWLSKVGNSKAKLLRVLIDYYPEAITRAKLAEYVEAAAGGGAFANKLSALKTLGLITYPTQGEARASDLLFPEGK
ncbi:DUF87 domain-containing protein [Candidatus Pacearchaeota archaeon]|jgi:hypothetical protein|nr:DUF87 domain-containing protein [Candidatus Pacearchaeota archaeon]